MVIGQNFVFLAVPRTASFWMARKFLPQYDGVYRDPHHLRIVPKEHEHKFTFACVRNPYDRMLSVWHHLAQCDHTYDIKSMTFPVFMKFLTGHWGEGGWCQHHFLDDARIDGVVRYEHLFNDLFELPFVQAKPLHFQLDSWKQAGGLVNASARLLSWRDEIRGHEDIVWKHSREDFERYGYERLEVGTEYVQPV